MTNDEIQNEALPPPKDYTEYWEAQVLLVRILQNSGLKVGVKDRLPLFRLYLLVDRRMTGTRRVKLIELLEVLAKLRISGGEPPNDGMTYK